MHKRLWIIWDSRGLFLFVGETAPTIQDGVAAGGSCHGQVHTSFATELGVSIEQGQVKELPLCHRG